MPEGRACYRFRFPTYFVVVGVRDREGGQHRRRFKSKMSLRHAVFRRDAAEVRRLLAAGADVSSGPTRTEMSLLRVAVAWGDADVVAALLAAGVDVNFSGVGGSPLVAAITYRNTSVVAALLAAGADVDFASDLDIPGFPFTPLTVTVLRNDRDLVEMLLGYGANVDLTVSSATPLNSAAANGSAKRASADVNARSNYGWTPLSVAADRGIVDVVRALLAAGADPNREELSERDTPLQVAARRGRFKVAAALLGAGADRYR